MDRLSRNQVRLALWPPPDDSGRHCRGFLGGGCGCVGSLALPQRRNEGRRAVTAKRKRPAPNTRIKTPVRAVHGREPRAQKLNLSGVVLASQPAPLGLLPWFMQKPPLPAHV
jgi:hypothetical protein